MAVGSYRCIRERQLYTSSSFASSSLILPSLIYTMHDGTTKEGGWYVWTRVVLFVHDRGWVCTRGTSSRPGYVFVRMRARARGIGVLAVTYLLVGCFELLLHLLQLSKLRVVDGRWWMASGERCAVGGGERWVMGDG